MSHVDDRVIELARTALALEFGGEHFYRHAAAQTRNFNGRQMFLRLAEEEKAHREETHVLFAALVGDALWKQLVTEEAAKPHASNVVAELEAAVARRGHMVVADDTQALRLAMELERSAIRLFDDLAQHAPDPELVPIMRKLGDEERLRYDLLQGQLDSVINVGLWLDQPEFRMDGKY